MAPTETSPTAMPRAPSVTRAPQTEPLVGDIGPYRILGPLGSGPCGALYRGERRQPWQPVTLQVLPAGTRADPEVVAATVHHYAHLDHPHIAPPCDGGVTADGRCFMVSPTPGGASILAYCAEHHVTLKDRLRLFERACAAVQCAHSRGMTHLALCPAHVRITVRNGRPHTMVFGFGVREILTDGATPAHPGFSPEQARGVGEIDARADIYALGALLYELVTTRAPFDPGRLERAGVGAACRIIAREEPRTPRRTVQALGRARGESTAVTFATSRSDLLRSLAGRLEWLVMRALEKAPHRRYRNSRDFLEDVRRHTNDLPILARPPRWHRRIRRACTGRRGRGLMLSALAAVAAWMVWWRFFR